MALAVGEALAGELGTLPLLTVLEPPAVSEPRAVPELLAVLDPLPVLGLLLVLESPAVAEPLGAGVGVGVAVGEALVAPVLGLGLAVLAGEPLAEVDGAAVVTGGWLATVVAGTAGDDVAG